MKRHGQRTLVKTRGPFGTIRHPSYTTLPTDLPCPIELLPLEIVQKLIRLALDPDYSDDHTDYTTQVTDLRLVCRYWNNAIITDASIWSHVDFKWGKGWFDHALVRSKQASLKVTCIYEGEDQSTFDVLDFLDGVWEHFERCGQLTLIFEVPPYAKPADRAEALFIGTALADILSIPAPRLEVVCVSIAGWYHHGPPGPFVLFGGEAPLLKTVEFVDSLLPFRSLGLTSLDTLTIENRWTPSLVDLLALLQRCPNITKLLITALDTNSDFDPSASMSRITLPALEKLEIRGLLQDGIAYLLGVIDAPNCEILKLDVNMRGLSLDNMMGEPILRLVNRSILATDMVSVMMGQGKFQVVTLLDEDPKVHITLHHTTNQMQSLRTLLANKTPFATPRLELIINGTTEEMLSVLGTQFPHTTRVDIDCRSPFDWQETLSTLFNKSPSSPKPVSSLAWPKLAALSFRGSKSLIQCDGADFLRFLRTRGANKETKRRVGSLTVVGMGMGGMHVERTMDLAEIDFIEAAEELSLADW